MVHGLPEHIKDVWERWNIRGLLILCLSLQTILIFFAPLRKRVSSYSLTMLLWSCYLLTDWSANFASGLISKNQWSDSKPNNPASQEKKLMALWSPFLLLHLGGPDTITAFSLEDNALWIRHFLGLVFQEVVCIFSILQSLPNPLWQPIFLVFVSGIIKYFERTMALNVASTGKFRKSGLLTKGLKRDDVEKVFGERPPRNMFGLFPWLKRRDRFLKEIVKPNRDLTDLEIVQFAFKLFNNFTSLVSNFVFSFKDVRRSRDFFEVLKPEEALMILETELCFIYDALYTKSALLHTKKGFLFRVIASLSLVWAFFRFHYRDHTRPEFQETDIIITYTLFLAGISLDLVSSLLVLLSDWKLAGISDVFSGILGFKSVQWKKQLCYKKDDFIIEHEVLAAPFLLRRWAGKVYAFNFFLFFLKTDGKNVQGRRDSSYMKSRRQLLFSRGSLVEWVHGVQGYIVLVVTSNKVARYILYPVKFLVQLFRFLVDYVIDRLDVEEFIDEIKVESFVSSEPLKKSLWSFIFEQVRYKSKFPDTEENRNRLSSARGGWALRETRGSMRLLHCVENVDYDESLLLWHIATEICYREESRENYDEDREFCKTLSDYMMYLMILQPQLMSEVAGLGLRRFKDAVAEAEELLEESIKESKDVKLACEKILSLVSDGVGELANENILQGVSSIVRKLKQLEESRKKWKILSKVWVELLCFASLHCDASARLELLSKGGELIDFVWLSMAHFGLVN